MVTYDVTTRFTDIRLLTSVLVYCLLTHPAYMQTTMQTLINQELGEAQTVLSAFMADAPNVVAIEKNARLMADVLKKAKKLSHAETEVPTAMPCTLPKSSPVATGKTAQLWRA